MKLLLLRPIIHSDIETSGGSYQKLLTSLQRMAGFLHRVRRKDKKLVLSQRGDDYCFQ